MTGVNIGKVNRDLGIMSPRVLSYCIDDALSNGDTGPIISLNLGISRGHNEYVSVDIDSLSSPVKRRMIQSNSDCGIWFKNYSKYIFELLCDATFPWTSLEFVIPKEEVMMAADTKTFAVMQSLEAFDYIVDVYPELIQEVKSRLIDNDTLISLSTYLRIIHKHWDDESDTEAAVKIIERSRSYNCHSCVSICDLQRHYPEIPDASYRKMITASLKKMWTKSNFHAMKDEDKDRFRKIYKLMVIKQGIPG